MYITFGQDHVHSMNGKTFDKDCVVVIECEDYAHGRQKAFDFFSDKWHNCYLPNEVDLPNLMQYFPRGLINVEGK